MDIHSHIYLLINDTAQTFALYSTIKCDGVYHVSFISVSYVYLVINDTWAHWCGLYHLLVGICENGYPLAHIPTNK